jgi:hypothetical protein
MIFVTIVIIVMLPLLTMVTTIFTVPHGYSIAFNVNGITVLLMSIGKIGTKECLSCPCITFVPRYINTAFRAASYISRILCSFCSTFTSPKEVDKLLRNLCQQTAYASKLYNMIQHGDRILVGVSGGKDSLTLVHILLALQVIVC